MLAIHRCFFVLVQYSRAAPACAYVRIIEPVEQHNRDLLDPLLLVPFKLVLGYIFVSISSG